MDTTVDILGRTVSADATSVSEDADVKYIIYAPADTSVDSAGGNASSLLSIFICIHFTDCIHIDMFACSLTAKL